MNINVGDYLLVTDNICCRYEYNTGYGFLLYPTQIFKISDIDEYSYHIEFFNKNRMYFATIFKVDLVGRCVKLKVEEV